MRRKNRGIEPLPPHVRLLHIGPHKTGTTAIQAALDQRRTELHQQGVHYAGDAEQAFEPARGLMGHAGMLGAGPPNPQAWEDLVAELREHDAKRVVVSSESFAGAKTSEIEQIREAFGRDRLHVVRMTRRYDALLPSWWQQLALAGHDLPDFPKWADTIVSSDPKHAFWRRHGFSSLTERWVDVVGRKNVSVVVVNDDDPAWLPSVIEQLIDVSEGTLVLPRARHNRSLTWGETEVLRHLSAVMRDAKWDGAVHMRYIRHGVGDGFKSLPSDPDAGRIHLPAALQPRIQDLTRAHVKALRKLKVNVIGDTDWLAPRPSRGGRDEAPTVSSATVVAGAVGVLQQAESATRINVGPEVRQFPVDAGLLTKLMSTDLTQGARAMVDRIGSNATTQREAPERYSALTAAEFLCAVIAATDPRSP